MLDPRVPNLVTPTRRHIAEFGMVLAGQGYKKSRVTVFLFNDLVVLAKPVEERKTLRTKSSSSLTPRCCPRDVWDLAHLQCTLQKECVALRGEDDGQETLLSACEGGPGLLEVMKLLTKTKLALAEVQATRPMVRSVSVETLRVISLASLCCYFSERKAQEDRVSVVKTEDEIEQMAEKTKAETVDLLNDMVLEAQRALAEAQEALSSVEDESQKKEKQKEVAALEQKLQGLQYAALMQNKKDPSPTTSRSPSRQRSSTEPFVFRCASHPNSNGSASSSPVLVKKSPGLFGSVRKKTLRRSEVSKDE